MKYLYAVFMFQQVHFMDCMVRLRIKLTIVQRSKSYDTRVIQSKLT